LSANERGLAKPESLPSGRDLSANGVQPQHGMPNILCIQSIRQRCA